MTFTANHACNGWYSQDSRYFIAHTSDRWYDCWRLQRPQATHILGAPFTSLEDAVAACEMDTGPEAA